MIVKILNRSASFNGSWLYHFHDKRSAHTVDGQKSNERVALYGLRNLGTDDPEAAFQQMALTWHNAHDLKRKAGISHKGRKCTKPLITIVLSYNSDYCPEGSEIQQDVEAVLATAGLTDNQAVWVVHDDTANIHAHIIVNAVNPDNGIAAQFDNKVAKRLQSWARDKERSIGLQCTGRENSTYKEPSRKFISAAERRARERAAYNPNLQPMIDQLSAELRQEWRELANKEREEMSASYERMRHVRDAGRVQRKIIKSQASKKIKHLYKRSRNPFFFTIAWLEKNEWKRLGKRTYAARRLFYHRERTLSGIFLNALHLVLSDMPHKKDFLHYLLSPDARRAGLEDLIGHEYACLRAKQKITKDAQIKKIRSAEYQCYASLARYVQGQIDEERDTLGQLKQEHLERRRTLKAYSTSRWDSIDPPRSSPTQRNIRQMKP